MGAGKGFFLRVHRPLQCLVFITPLLLIYQIGALLHPWSLEQEGPNHVIAFVLMLRFFSLFGAAGSWLPLAAVVAILLAWHLARKDPWDFDPELYLGMAIESIVWALPIFIISLAVIRQLPAWATEPVLAAAGTNPAADLPWPTAAVISVGAGIYEELLFRLERPSRQLNMILVDMLKMRIQRAIPLIILTSSLLFSLYHGLDSKAPGILATPGYYIILMALGVYFSGIFIFRGFGIAVGCHAVYDLIVVATANYRGH